LSSSKSILSTFTLHILSRVHLSSQIVLAIAACRLAKQARELEESHDAKALFDENDIALTDSEKEIQENT
jgi:hypothetical protein